MSRNSLRPLTAPRRKQHSRLRYLEQLEDRRLLALAPVAENDSYPLPVDQQIDIAAGQGVLANDTSSAGALTAHVFEEPSDGVLTFASDGSFSYLPNAGFSGDDSFVYYATDADGVSSMLAAVTLRVGAASAGPVALPDNYAVNEGSALAVVAANGVLANDLAVGGGPLTAELSADVAHGVLALADDGSFTYTPEAGYEGTDSFTYVVHEGAQTSSAATVTITVRPTNQTPTTANDAYSTSEDQPLDVVSPGGILANDADGDSDPLTIVLQSDVQHGELDLHDDGTFTYTPDPNYHGVDGFSYKVTDGAATSTVATVTISVNSVNDVPVAGDDAYSVDEDGVLTSSPASVLDNDTDADVGAALTVALGTDAAHGDLVLNPDGTFTYIPDANFHGTDTFTYTVSDGVATSSEATVTITVNAVNDAPEPQNDLYSVNEDEVLTATVSILANDNDIDGDALTILLESDVQFGDLVLNPDGTFTYTSDPNFHGTDGFSYKVSDGTTVSTVVTVTIDVISVNDTPVASDDAYSVDEDGVLASSPASVLDNDTDVDVGDTLTVTLGTDVTNGALALNADGTFTYTPAANFHGVDSFTYTASDGTATSSEVTVTITVNSINDAPEPQNDLYTVNEDEVLVATTSIFANDTDLDGDTLTIVPESDVQFGDLVLNPDGTFTYTPAANFHGTDGFSYKVSDGTTVSTVVTVTIDVISVNDTPIASDDAYSVDEDGVLTSTPASVLDNDSDVDVGDTLTVTLGTDVANGALTLNPDGTFTYTPDENFHGVDSFTYTVSDGTATSTAATVTITVNSINDAPVASDDSYTVDEDGVLNSSPASVLDNDTDADGGNELTIVTGLTVTLGTDVAHGALTLNADGTFTYTPAANFHGVDSFTYTASDGTATSNAATVTITVNSVNDAPVAENDVYDVNEDEVLVSPGSILDNDSDADGDALVITTESDVQFGDLILNPDGTFTYTPDADFSGTDGFSYKVSDGTDTSTVVTVTINVHPVNDAPVASDDAYTVDEDAVLATTPASVLDNDTDADAGDTLTVTLGTDVANGALVLNSDGTFTYTPAANFNGVDTFTYTISDGTTTSNEATVTITVGSVNDAPVALPDSYTTDEDIPLDVPAPGVLANDTDADGDVLSAILVSGPQHGTLSMNSDGSFNYTPHANFTGTDTFMYCANDGSLSSADTLVTITVNPVDDAPTAFGDAYALAEDIPLTVAAGSGVLANDSDIEGVPLTATVVDLPTHGSLVLNSDGSFTYTPDADYHGTDSFTYKASDGVTESSLTVVQFTVQPLNDTPVSAADEYHTNVDTPLTVAAAEGVLANDTDADNDGLSATLISGPASGVLALASDGSFTYTPASGFTGEVTFRYQATDGISQGAVTEVTIVVGEDEEPENTAPSSTDDAYNVESGEVLDVAAPGVLANDSDADGDALTVTVVTQPEHGTLVLNADGSFTYTPDDGYVGADSFTYQANDGADDSAAATVAINVTAPGAENSPPVASNDTYAATANVPLVVVVPGVLGNDNDSDGDPLTAAVVDDPLHGTVSLAADGSFTYTPDAGYIGTDSFTYAAHDGTSAGNTATVTITIAAPGNAAPVAKNDVFDTTVGTPLNVPAPGVLGNDTDADGDTLTAILFSGPHHGTVNLAADGSFVYTPDDGYDGESDDSFVYRVFDGNRYSALAAVTIRFAPVQNTFAFEDGSLGLVAGGHHDDETDLDALDEIFGYDDLLA